jgi:hypothetical protein
MSGLGGTQTAEPDLVIAAVRQVVEAARWGSSVVVTPDRR